MIGTIAAGIALLLALVPLSLYALNTRLYRVPPARSSEDRKYRPEVSVLIPARNEERSIGAAVEAVLASEGVDVEVIVLDDDSSDGTRGIVERIAERDDRVSVFLAPPLPPGWCGKQHACWKLSTLARRDLLVFLDADVRVTPTGIARTVDFLRSSGAELVSGVPRQECGSFFERLLLPLINFLLLGFLPIGRMRRSSHPAYSAGCGQLFATRRECYERAGGHAAIRASLHDGLTLPTAFRRAGFKTDLFDATPLSSCRMYRGAREVWSGLAKNATEGLASPLCIVPFTVLLLGGQVLPVVLLACGLLGLSPVGGSSTIALAALGTLAACAPRLEASRRFSQPLSGALLHPLGVTLLIAIQWYALSRQIRGRPTSWKGRSYREGEYGETAHASGT